MWLRRKEGAILLINGNRMSGSKQQSFIKGSAILIASNMIIKGINFLLLPLYTKYLTPEMLGISDSISNFTAILFPLLVMGLDSAFSAFYFDKHDENHHHKVMNTIRITMLIASLVPILMAAASKPFALMLFDDSEYYMLVVVSLISILQPLAPSILTACENEESHGIVCIGKHRCVNSDDIPECALSDRNASWGIFSDIKYGMCAVAAVRDVPRIDEGKAGFQSLRQRSSEADDDIFTAAHSECACYLGAGTV